MRIVLGIALSLAVCATQSATPTAQQSPQKTLVESVIDGHGGMELPKVVGVRIESVAPDHARAQLTSATGSTIMVDATAISVMTTLEGVELTTVGRVTMSTPRDSRSVSYDRVRLLVTRDGPDRWEFQSLRSWPGQ